MKPHHAALLAVALGAALPAAAQQGTPQKGTPTDWPCVQVYVPELSLGQVWAGPALPDEAGAWRDDPEVARLVPKLLDDAVPAEDATARAEDFAKGVPEAERERRLALLFQGLFERAGVERGNMFAGIRRFADKQKALADRIAEANAKLRGMRLDVAAGSQPEMEAARAERDWDLRVLDDRQRLLPQVCEQPVLLEQRLFALGRALQGNL
ncbi:MAG: hypothetical protein KDG89_10810 [Geminicoccaceae bacterium]|nr:hypothetical protein [Geminicoccaceae bacterium]